MVPSDDVPRVIKTHGRRHPTPRFLFNRCRIIIICAEGLQSWENTERIGVHNLTFG